MYNQYYKIVTSVYNDTFTENSEVVFSTSEILEREDKMELLYEYVIDQPRINPKNLVLNEDEISIDVLKKDEMIMSFYFIEDNTIEK